MRYRQGAKLGGLVGILMIPACSWGGPPKPFSSEVMPTDAIAEITEIADRPVWIRFLNSNTDNIATIGKNIKLGESIRTEGTALVQITLTSGMVIRMEGDSLLTINDDQKIELTRGQIVVWVPPQSRMNAEIMLTGAIAKVNKNTTVYLDSSNVKQIIGLQGTVNVLPIDTSNPIAIKSGQKLIISNRDGANLRPKTLTEKELKTQFNKTKLLSGFNSTLGSQQEIASNLRIPISPTEFIIPPNRPIKPTSKPVNPPPEYIREPEGYQKRSEPERSYEREPEPPQKEPINKPVEELPPPVQPEIIPIDEPPQPEQPEENQP
jgi:hypothetical protein